MRRAGALAVFGFGLTSAAVAQPSGIGGREWSEGIHAFADLFESGDASRGSATVP